MQAAGNDFVVFDGRYRVPLEFPEAVTRLCDRRFGVGADGVIIIQASRAAEFLMQYFNSDGSSALCGNGIRCAARFIHENGLLPAERNSFEIETLKGPVAVEVHGAGARISVEMGAPVLDGKYIPVADDGEQFERDVLVGDEHVRISPVGMGNPHCVFFVNSRAELARIEQLGPQLEVHEFYPEKTNVEAVFIEDEVTLHVRVWERGVGETLACGTGACACLVAAHRAGKSGRHVKVLMRGGELEVKWMSTGEIVLTGPAVRVFNGELHSSFNGS